MQAQVFFYKKVKVRCKVFCLERETEMINVHNVPSIPDPKVPRQTQGTQAGAGGVRQKS